MLGHKMLCLLDGQLLTLVVADEVQQGVGRQDQVLAGVQARGVVEDASHRHRVVDLLLLAACSEVHLVATCVPGHRCCDRLGGFCARLQISRFTFFAAAATVLQPLYLPGVH